MDPLSWITLGSAGIKLIGKLFGGKTEAVADKVAGFVDDAQLSADPEKFMEERMSELPVDDLIEFKKLEVEVMRIDAGKQKVVIEANTARYGEDQASYRKEITSSDEYVRHTRPSLARKSFWIGTLYALGMEGLKAFLAFKSISYGGADLTIAAMLYAPLGAYTAGRTAESFSDTGKTAGGGGMKDIIGLAMGQIRK